MIWVLFLLATAVVVGVFIWDYRRKSVARETARQDRFERMFDPKAAAAPAAAPAEPTVAQEPAQQAGEVLAESAPKLPPAAAVERFLDPPARLAYLLLRTGLPDHEIFPRVALSAVVSAGTGIDREQHRRRLSRYQLDFVVCDRDMRVVAVVEVNSPGKHEAPADRQVKSDTLQSAGIRLVELNSAALPRREAVRALIQGGEKAR